jgi:hypothetical protein
MDPTEATMAAAGAAAEQAQITRETVDELRQLVRDQNQPAGREQLELTQQTPIVRSEARDLALSVGVDTSDADSTAALAGGPVVVELLRFKAVQPAFLGSR